MKFYIKTPVWIEVWTAASHSFVCVSPVRCVCNVHRSDFCPGSAVGLLSDCGLYLNPLDDILKGT